MSEMKEPKHLKVLRILGVIMAIAGVVLIVLSFTLLSNGDIMGTAIPNALTVGVGGFLTFAGISMISAGLLAKKSILGTKIMRYTVHATEEDMTDIANTKADIIDDAVTHTVRAVKKGLKDTVYCKHCGAEIDNDSTFCKHCGKSQL